MASPSSSARGSARIEGWPYERRPDRIEWKSKIAGGDIKVRDIIALSWIPLSLLPDLPANPPAPQNTYRNKGECAKLFDDLMSDDNESTRNSDGLTRTSRRRRTTLAEVSDAFSHDLSYRGGDPARGANKGLEDTE
jgi:hypothetical protein